MALTGGRRMKKFILLIILAFLVNIPVLAKTIINPIERIGSISTGSLYTTKVTTEEGTYRIFVYNSGYGAGITTVKIK